MWSAMVSEPGHPGRHVYDRWFLLGEKRNELLSLWEVQQYGRDSFGDPHPARRSVHRLGIEKRIRKFIPTSPLVCLARASSPAATASAGCSTMLTMPRPPASATAAASSGVATPPMPACWIGTWHPTRSVKAVVNIVGHPQSHKAGRGYAPHSQVWQAGLKRR